MSRPSRFPRGHGQHKGPLSGTDASPPASAPSPTSALPRHPRLFRCPKDSITPCVPRGSSSRRSTKLCPALACAYPTLAPTAELSLVPCTTTAWRTQGHGAAGPEGPQPIPSAPAGRCSTGSPGPGITASLPLPMARARHAQPLIPLGWQASLAAGLRGGTGMGHAGAWGRTWGAPCPHARHGCGA